MRIPWRREAEFPDDRAKPRAVGTTWHAIERVTVASESFACEMTPARFNPAAQATQNGRSCHYGS